MIFILGDNKRTIRIFGVLGIIVAIVAVSADIATGFSNVPAQMNSALSLGLENISILLVAKPHWQLVLGHYLAIFSIPLEGLFVVSHTYFGLKSAGKLASGVFWYVGVFLFAIGAAYHGTIGLLAEAIQTGDEALINLAGNYFEPLGTAITIIAVGWAVYLFFLVLSGRTDYPRWMAFLSPISVMLISTLIILVVPAEWYWIKTFITVTGLNMPVLIWVFCSTILLWKQPE